MLRKIFTVFPKTWIGVYIGLGLIWMYALYILVLKFNVTSNAKAMTPVKYYNKDLLKWKNVEIINELQKNFIALSEKYMDVEKAERFMEKFNRSLGLFFKEFVNVECNNVLNLNYENMRRRVHDNVIEMYNFYSNKTKELAKKLSNESFVDDILKLGIEHKHSILNDMKRMRENDGYDLWREQEAIDLSNLIQHRLHSLQNPTDCLRARKILCSINKQCGYGCQLHHIVYCLIVAYVTNRTLFLESKDLLYNTNSWESVFLPLSHTCDKIYNLTAGMYSELGSVIRLSTVDHLRPRSLYLAPSIPKGLAPRIKRLHRSPIAWWIGQFLKYILRPQSSIKEMLTNNTIKLDWPKHIVGVHVRRTEKAPFHSLKEYMIHVEECYLGLELDGNKFNRCIYLATDDVQVFKEARNEYPHYRILTRENITVETKLERIFFDIYFLSLSNYLVCTFSSNICRVAYEIMQTLHVDASDRFKSLDDIYHFVGQNAQYFRTIIPHKARNDDELNLEVGDLVSIDGNHWNGYSEGVHIVTKQRGLFPTFKVAYQIEESNMFYN